MDRFAITRMIINIMEERGYLGAFDIYCYGGHITVAMTVDNRSISRILSVTEINACKEPRYMIRLAINDMINQIRSGGQTND